MNKTCHWYFIINFVFEFTWTSAAKFSAYGIDSNSTKCSSITISCSTQCCALSRTIKTCYGTVFLKKLHLHSPSDLFYIQIISYLDKCCSRQWRCLNCCSMFWATDWSIWHRQKSFHNSLRMWASTASHYLILWLDRCQRRMFPQVQYCQQCTLHSDTSFVEIV